LKLSIVLSTQPASFSALAYQGELEQTIAKISDLGYDGVELAVRDPGLLDIASIKSFVQANKLVVPAIGTGQAYGEEGLSLASPDADIRTHAIERLMAHAEFASEFGAVVIIGLIRGTTSNRTDYQKACSLVVKGLRTLGLSNPAVQFAVEPINRYETDLVITVEAGLELVAQIGLDNVGLLLDTFHMNIEEPDVLQSIRSAASKIFHFHVADSNRWYPGAGHIDFSAILKSLDSVGYEGFISAEIMPFPDSDISAARTIEHLRALPQ